MGKLNAVASDPFTIGVEEEFFLVDADTGALRLEADAVVATSGERVHHELQACQVETETPVCETLDEVRTHLDRLRRDVDAAAQRTGCRIASLGTHPFAGWEGAAVTGEAPYLRLERDYQQLAREQLVCGCHVHVCVEDREDAIQVVNHVRPWLPTVLALTGNSPFWLGADTGYASFRTEIWRRWPTSGTPDVFEDRADYDALVETMLAAEVVDDPARIYWDVRPSAKFDTVEFRVADACLTVDRAVMVAGLVRALVRTVDVAVRRGDAPPRPRTELLRAATWRAARYGVAADLLDPVAGQAAPAAAIVDRFLAFVGPNLEDGVEALVKETMAHGTGATRQREIQHRTGDLRAVVERAVALTVGEP